MSEKVLEKEEEKWRHLIEECRSSPLSVISYCKKHHISKTGLYKWAKKFGLSLKKDEKPKVNFIELPSLKEEAFFVSEKDVLSLEVTTARGVGLKLEAHWSQVVSLIKELC